MGASMRCAECHVPRSAPNPNPNPNPKPKPNQGRAAAEFTATEARCAVKMQRLWRERVRQGRQGLLQPGYTRTRGASAAMAVQSAARGRQARRGPHEG